LTSIGEIAHEAEDVGKSSPVASSTTDKKDQ
jgi:hypothetical protein